MSLIKWDPYRDFNAFRTLTTNAWHPVADIFETDGEVVLKMELPGTNPKDVRVKLENNVLTIKGERHFEKEAKEENYHRVEREYGTFTRAFALPVSVNQDKVTAVYKDGVLKIVLPKREEVKSKSIDIAAA
jgi:HSP20 family protein